MKLRPVFPLLLAAFACRSREPADLVLHYGKIVTADDLIVLSDDLLEIDPEKILEVEVLMTILDGRGVHDELEDRRSALPSTDRQGRVAQQVIDLQ